MCPMQSKKKFCMYSQLITSIIFWGGEGIQLLLLEDPTRKFILQIWTKKAQATLSTLELKK